MTKQTRIWFTADPHVGGHRLVSRIRGFIDESNTEEHRHEIVFAADTEAHDIQVANNWDSVVSPDDVVYVLGDISINGSQKALDWFKERPGVKVLASGNHDPVHPGFFRNGFKKVAAWREVFADIQPYYRLSLLGKVVLLSHLPYSGTGAEGRRDNGEEVEERGPQWRLPDLGAPLLHGHVHETYIETFSDKGTPKYHVGMDAHNLTPVPQEKIIEWLQRVCDV